MADDQDLRNKSNEAVNKIKEKSEDDFEKQLIFIASGALGISFAFLEKLVNLSKSIYLWTLAVAWVCLALALCVNLWSHYLSKNLAEKSIDDQDDYHDRKMDYEQLCANIKRRNSIIDRVNYSSIAALFLGLTFLIVFVTINISHMSQQKPQTKPGPTPEEQRGRTIPIPRPQVVPPQQKPLTSPTGPIRQSPEK
jgi:hypothetical protein